jgi:branched-chain amino acid transport system permease protein
VTTDPPLSNSTAGSVFRAVLPFGVAIAIAIVAGKLQEHVIADYASVVTESVGIAMILAISLNIVNGMTGQFSIGHAGFLAIGGYTAGLITYYGSLMLWQSTARHGGSFGGGEWLFVAATFAGGLVAAGAGYIVGLPSLRLRGDYLAIVTLGFGEIIRVLLQQTNPTIREWQKLKESRWNELFPPPVGGALGFSGVPKYTNLFWIGLFLSLTMIAAYRLKASGIGRAMLAVREDEIAAQAMGVNTTRVKVRSFVIAAFLAGVGGSLFAHKFAVNIMPADAGFQRSFDYVIMTVLGGKGSITGVMAAAMIITVLPEVLRGFEDYRLIVYSLMLIGMMLLRPQGLFGSWEIWDLFSRKKRITSEAAA